MKLTPLEIKQKNFKTGFRGADPDELSEFLALVSEEMEEILRENNELKDKKVALEQKLEEFETREKTLKETLVTAQKMAEDVKEVAERESRAILSNAELEGEKIIREAMLKRENLLSELHDLKRQKVQFETTLRNAIEIHLKMMDAMNEQYEVPSDAEIEKLSEQTSKKFDSTEDQNLEDQ